MRVKTIYIIIQLILFNYQYVNKNTTKIHCTTTRKLVFEQWILMESDIGAFIGGDEDIGFVRLE